MLLKTWRENGDSQKGFDDNWRNRQEASYNHWTRGRPKNQIQLAFRKHWELFREILGEKKGRKCLEVGCGRGSISSYFADNGFDCTLLDVSFSVLGIAKSIFAMAGHKADLICGDVRSMPFKDNEFDVVVSIGLLEHFEEVSPLMKEQIRILKTGGSLLCYIVPENPDNIQKYFLWINLVLKFLSPFFSTYSSKSQKAEIYRNDSTSDCYLRHIDGEQVSNVKVMGLYPLPMISHSPEFPFTLLPPAMERILSKIFNMVLYFRKKMFRQNAWICKEKTGQAFLLALEKRIS